MDNESVAPSLAAIADFQQSIPGFMNNRPYYYLAFAGVAAFVWLFCMRSDTSKLDIPFYKASKTKWIFDAETLIKDSYQKVISTSPQWSLDMD